MGESRTIVRRAALAAGVAITASAAATAAAKPRTPAPAVNAKILARAFGLRGKIALVTGSGGSGHPEVLATLLAAGATVVSADIRPIGYEELAKNPGPGLKRLSHVQLDFADEQSVKRCLEEVVARHGRIDILVNACGVYIGNRLTDVSTAEWEEVQKLDLTSNFWLMREAVRHMVATKTEGRIVNLSTIGARQTVRRLNAAYGAARAGVSMLGRVTAHDYAEHGIRVNTILVGRVGGGRHVRMLGDERIRAAGGQIAPLGASNDGRQLIGGGSLSDVAAAVLFLVGPSGAYITGQELGVDGGYYVS